MISNPLFIRKDTLNSANVNPKQTKSNNPSYLFSDIIRLLNDSSTDQNVTVSNESILDKGKNNLIFSSISNNLSKDSNSKSLNQSAPIAIVKEAFIESGQIIKWENINVSDSIDIVPSKIDLIASLKKMFKGVMGNGITLKNVGALNNLTTTSKIEIGKGNNVNNNLINPLKNNKTLGLNFNLLGTAVLSFNDKQQLEIKLFNSESNQNKVSEKPVITDKSSIDKKLEKIASLLFGLLTQLNSLPNGNVIQQKTFDSATVNTNGAQNIYQLDSNVKDTILSHLNSNKPLILNITLGGENLKIEITSEPGKKINNEIQTPNVLPNTENSKIEIVTELGKKINNEIQTPNILPDTENLKIEIVTESGKKINNEIQTPNVLPDTENLKIEIITESGKKINNEIQTPNVLPDTENLKIEIITESGKKINNVIQKPDVLLGTENPKIEIITESDKKINSEIKTEQLPAESSKKFILKITPEVVNKHSQSINTLKEMLKKMFVKEKIEVKVLTPENKQIFKTESQQIVELLSKDKNVIVKTNNSIPDTNQTNQKIPKVNGVLNAENNVSGNLVGTIDNLIRKSPESKKEAKVNKTEINSNKNIFDTLNRQVVTDISETPDKGSEQKPSSDKNEFFDLRLTGNQVNTLNTNIIKNGTTQNIFKMFGENNITVKASNLVNEMSRLFEQGKSKSVVLKLKPDNLGEVKIVLDVVDKVVSANIQVNNEAVKQIVQNNINTLIQSLNASGLQLSSFNVSLNNNESKESKTNSQKKRSSNMRIHQKISEDNGAIITKSMGYNTYDFII